MSNIEDTAGREWADYPTVQMPVIRDDDPPTAETPAIRDYDQPTTIMAAVTRDPAVYAYGETTAARAAAPQRSQPVAVPAPNHVAATPQPVPTASGFVPPAPHPARQAVPQPVPQPAAQPVSKPATQPVTPAPSAGRTKPKRRKGLVALIVVLVVALIAAGALFAVNKYYDGKAKIGTKIAGVNVAGQTADELAATAQSIGGSFTIDTSFNGQQKSFTMADLGVTLDAQKTAQDALAADQGGFNWLPLHNVDVPLAYTYSAEQVQQALMAAFVTADQQPQDATVSLDEDGIYTSTPAQDGVTINPAPVTDAIDTLATGGTVSTVTLTPVPLMAAIQTSAADQAAAAANALVGQTYTFTAGGKSVTLGSGQLAPYVTFTPNPGTGALDVALDQAGLTAGLPDMLNVALAQPPVNERDLYTPDGSKMVAVAIPGQDGTGVSDADIASAAQALGDAMNAGNPLTMAVNIVPQKFSVEKIPLASASDVPSGTKWIDVNLTTFKVTLYQGTTQIYQTTSVTGAVATPTQPGTYHIDLRYQIQTMRGHNADGTPYITPNVPWVSYFNGSQALHGAYWRSTFGYQASHGCVNLAVSDAKFVYDWAPMGTKVVVHN